MNHVEGIYRGVREVNHYYKAWLPDGEVNAVLLIVHGLGEHNGRYMNVVNHFVPLGYAVYGCDHLGHGRYTASVALSGMKIAMVLCVHGR